MKANWNNYKFASADLAEFKERFMRSLEAIRSFSARQHCDPFTACFDRALETLSAQDLKAHGYHRDLSPAGFLNAGALAVLDAAQSCYVFGGMGSWNDLGFDNQTQKEYQLVSDDLFKVLNEAIVAATNTSFYQGQTGVRTGRSDYRSFKS